LSGQNSFTQKDIAKKFAEQKPALHATAPANNYPAPTFKQEVSCDGQITQLTYEKIMYNDGTFRGLKVRVPYAVLDALGYGNGLYVLNFYAARPPVEGEPNCYQPDKSKWFGSVYIPESSNRDGEVLEGEINPQESLGDPLWILAVPEIDD